MCAYLGPSLTAYLKAVEEEPVFRYQLLNFVVDTKNNMLSNAAKSAVADHGSMASKFLDAIAKQSQYSLRLIGRQANLLLQYPWKLVNIMFDSLKENKRVPRKVKKEYILAVSAIASYLFCIKKLVLEMSIGVYTREDVDRLAKQFWVTAKQQEYVQSFLFPRVNRVYDVIMTCCAPELYDDCAKFGFSPGALGLTEGNEAKHGTIENEKSMPLGIEAAKRLNRDSWTKTVVIRNWLRDVYREKRKDTRTPAAKAVRKAQKVEATVLSIDAENYEIQYADGEIKSVEEDFVFERPQNGEGVKVGDTIKTVKRITNTKNAVRDEREHKRFKVSHFFDPLETPHLYDTQWNHKDGCGCGQYDTFKNCPVCRIGEIESIMSWSKKCAEHLVAVNVRNEVENKNLTKQLKRIGFEMALRNPCAMVTASLSREDIV
jgi:hypothetical protein